ncbi:hypothetical protein [Nocardia asiatica]|uniref:hypothetical protein n=1 Tax=Nocardia asiatica TaxID=209252 RepID=UPI0024554A66|nr:hypothetical protein [Nocardia asiatica]
MNTPETYIAVATYALGKFSGDQLYFPNAGDATVLSWAETFAASKLTPEEIRAGVLHVVLNAEGGDFRPMPADILRGARSARREAIQALPQKAIDEMEAANYILQDIGYTPQEAHRISRQVAIGHSSLDQLLDAPKLAEFQELFEQHRNRDKTYKDRRREIASTIKLANLFGIESKQGRAS